MSLDKEIRFVGIAIMEGRIIAAEYQKDVIPLLSRQESELSIMQALIRMNTRKTLSHKLGRPLFSLTEYERIMRSTIMVYDLHNKFGLGGEFVIMLSIKKTAANPTKIIRDTVMSYVEKKFAG